MMSEHDYVEVALPVPLRQSFTYKLDGALKETIASGSRVAVPFNRRKLSGFVVGFAEAPPPNVSRVLKVAGLLDAEPVFDAELLGFLEQAARYYFHPLGEVLRAAAPALPTGAMKKLVSDGFLESGQRLPGRKVHRPKTLSIRRSDKDVAGHRLGARQKQVLALVEQHETITLEGLRPTVKSARSVVLGLRDKGLVAVDEVDRVDDRFFQQPVSLDTPPTLTPPQSVAVDSIVARLGQGGAFLLHGVTGSGKTEVYLRAIKEATTRGYGVIVLVPEIALTPQLVHRFRARFGDQIAVMHSGLKERQRDEAWRALRSGEIKIAIGARSALFAPVHNLGLIVVDEEHDPSFKQEEGFRYHARDMALLRGDRADAVCVLGSATPSVESFYAATQGKYTLVTLPARATGQSMPPVEIVDLRRQTSGPAGTRLLSGPLVNHLRDCVANQNQAILFLNRRGFAPSLRCPSCGVVAQCPACSVALTEHRALGRLRCHYCDFSTPVSTTCSDCGAPDLQRLGLGTEQLAATLSEAHPQWRVARLDRDTATTEGIEEVLGRVRDGEVDVLVGTQMVTKGHDVAGVTLVGAVLADQSLAFPDFRATERTFQLLTQVAGRAGRGSRPGRVVFQTYQPTHFAVRAASAHDFEAFYAAEIEARSEVGYPPFGRLVAVRVDAGSQNAAQRTATELARKARQYASAHDLAVAVLGPAPAPLARLRGRFRYRVMLRSSNLKSLRATAAQLAAAIDAGVSPSRATLDVDPVSML